jgi:hypothetical protein
MDSGTPVHICQESLTMVRTLIQTIQIYLSGLEFTLQNEIQALAAYRSTLDRALEIVNDLITGLDEESPPRPAPVDSTKNTEESETSSKRTRHKNRSAPHRTSVHTAPRI